MTNEHWKRLLNDDKFMQHFPNKFFKTVPPKDYFWQVYAVVKPNEYRQAIDKAYERLGTFKRLIRNDIKVTNEALEVFNDFSDSELFLVSKHNKQRMPKNSK